MNAVLSKASASETQLINAEEFISSVNDELSDIKHSFFRIGYRLNEALEKYYYRTLGYANITDLALDKFGFSKSTTYELINIYKLARGETSQIMSTKYEKYTQTQLRELCRLNYRPDAFMRIVQPTDTVTSIGRAVTLWNKYASKHSCNPDVNSISELLSMFGESQREPETSSDTDRREYTGQLPGQICIEEGRNYSCKENSAYAENIAATVNGKFEIEAQKAAEENIQNAASENEYLSDADLIEYCIKLGPGFEGGKYRLYDKVLNGELTKEEFKEYVKQEYGKGWTPGGKYCKSIESGSSGLTIERHGGGKLILSWTIVAGRIRRLIESGEYLTATEQSEYLTRKAENDGLKIALEPVTALQNPEPPRLNLKNESARKEWLDNYRSWGVWLEVSEVNKTFYRYEFANGAALIVETGTAYYYGDKESEYKSYSIIDKNRQKYNSAGISYTLVISWLTTNAKEI